ncbi:MAG: hypothetical protein IH585_07110 [Anaerolineaceae bacterium]|nr:hypothetical protein [Anaerolineaceae bacterium]
MIVAVVDDGTFQIDPYVKNTVDYAQYQGHYYSDKPPGAAFLGIPIYAGIKMFLQTPVIEQLVIGLTSNSAIQATLNPQGTGISLAKLRFAIAQVIITYMLATLPTLGLALLLYRFLRKLGVSPNLGILTVAGYGLMTPAFAYANAFYSHQLSAALLFAAFYLSSDQKYIGRICRLLPIGFLLGYAVISEYPVLLIVFVLFVFTFYQLISCGKWKRIVWVILSGLPVLIGWLIYNNAVFGSPFALGYGYSTAWTVQHHTGFMSITYPHLDAIWGITFDPFRGLFILSPLLLLFIPGIIVWWRSNTYRAEWFVSTSVIGLMFLFTTSSIMWWGGFAIGPRYFLPALPFMIPPLGIFLARMGHLIKIRVLVGIIFLGSLAATWILTLAGQAFPTDTIRNPILEYALPNWQSGNIARNLGTILGLNSLFSLLPYVFLIMGILVIWTLLTKRVNKILKTQSFHNPVPTRSITL